MPGDALVGGPGRVIIAGGDRQRHRRATVGGIIVVDDKAVGHRALGHVHRGTIGETREGAGKRAVLIVDQHELGASRKQRGVTRGIVEDRKGGRTGNVEISIHLERARGACGGIQPRRVGRGRSEHHLLAWRAVDHGGGHPRDDHRHIADREVRAGPVGQRAAAQHEVAGDPGGGVA